jgi:hypothetical protein
MAKVAVGEGVGRALEEDDNGVEFTKRANTRMVDVVVDVLGGDVEVCDCVYTV